MSRKADHDKDKSSNVSYLSLFRYSTKLDRILICLALMASLIAAIMQTYAIHVVSNIFQDMVEYEKSSNLKGRIAKLDEYLLSQLHSFAIHYSLIGLILFIGAYLGSSLMNITAINQIFKIRIEYLKAVLNQDFEYLDFKQTGDFASNISQDLIKLEEGIGDKLSTLVYLAVSAVSCITMALIRGWKMALLYLMSSPLSFLLVGLTSKFAQKEAKKEAAASGKASVVAEEALSAIKTVYSFNGQQKEIERYAKPLAEARKIDKKKEILTGLTTSLLLLCLFCTYGLAFYLGVYLIIHDPEHYNAGVMFAVFMGVVAGLGNLGMIAQLAGSFGTARGAGSHVFSLMTQVPKINPLLDRGLKPGAIEGNIDFQNVFFHYPSRPEIPVLQGLRLSVKHGQSIALVGPSGSGKSTTIQLISRYYDVIAGKVLVDGRDVRELSVRWLRAQVGLVGQEPVLFNTTVRQNIRYGREGATDSDIETAARQANAHNFIMKLPKGYDTLLGERGATISGGQKQRIAIARALVRNPHILLLDEATSALDTASEAIVQTALDKASKGRTTVIVAHRLTTIQNVDNICVLKNGVIVEQGSHKDLMKMRGTYYKMANSQGLEEVDVTKGDPMGAEALAVEPEEIIIETKKSEEELKEPPVSICRLVKLNSPEWKAITVGSICSIVLGFVFPLYIIAFGHLFSALTRLDTDMMLREVLTIMLAFIGIGVVMGTFNIIEAASFGSAGAYLTERLRLLMFKHMLSQQVAFFDEEAHSTGALCARLASETANIRKGTGQRIGTILQSFGGLSFSLIMSFINEWRIGLVAMSFIPLIAVIVYFQIKVAKTESFGQAKAIEKSTKIAVEAISNIRTVASLGREQKFVEEFLDQLRPAVGPAKRSAHCTAVVTGFAKCINYLANTATLTYGGHLMVSDGLNIQNILICSQSLQMVIMQIQNAFTYFPEIQKGLMAASRVISFLNQKPTMADPKYPKITPFIGTGTANFNHVDFRYPTRPNYKLLCDLELQVQQGRTVALVGESGCGKSTVMNLLQRFYDPEAGSVDMDKITLPELLMKDIRANLGLVSQEPMLFDRSIRENIAYGDNSRESSEEEIVAAATQAHIHEFITTLPEGYETNVGAKGVQLSGGQKQRVAIARALLKKPKILLLDEATSALDVESEKEVQESLDAAKAGRTCLMIAHRMSTVRDADVICVFQGGRIMERGTHHELMRTDGIYQRLNSRRESKFSE